MKKTLKRLCTGFLALVTVVTALPTTPVHAESKQSPLPVSADSRRKVLSFHLKKLFYPHKWKLNVPDIPVLLCT